MLTMILNKTVLEDLITSFYKSHKHITLVYYHQGRTYTLTILFEMLCTTLAHYTV